MGQIVYVNYGHHSTSQDLYAYYDPGNRRTGDNIVVEVTHWKKPSLTYKTLATVRATTGTQTDKANITVGELNHYGIDLKTVPGVSQKTLPGYFRGWGNINAISPYDESVQRRMKLPGMQDSRFKSVGMSS